MLTVLIPAYNEEKVIQETIDKVHTWSEQQEFKIELIIINNSSTDSTEEILKFNKSDKNLLRYKNQSIKGKGYAIKSGLDLSTSKVLILDADLSVSVDQFQKEWLDLNNVIISGSRFSGEVIGTPLRRNFSGKVFSTIVKKYFDIPVEDTQCGFKYISFKNMSKVADNLSVGNFSYDVDLLLTMKKFGAELIDVPVTYIHNHDSSVRIITDSVRMLKSLLKLKKKYY